MSNLTQFFSSGGVRPIAINGRSLPAAAASAPGNVSGVTLTTSGAVTANTLKTVLSVTGKGALTWLGVRTENTSAKTARIRITLDGVVVYDSTSPSDSTSGRWSIAHGAADGSNWWPAIEGIPLMYEASLLVQYACSITETDGVKFGYINYLR